jgi:hypothetical protein
MCIFAPALVRARRQGDEQKENSKKRLDANPLFSVFCLSILTTCLGSPTMARTHEHLLNSSTARA